MISLRVQVAINDVIIDERDTPMRQFDPNNMFKTVGIEVASIAENLLEGIRPMN